MPLQIHCLDDLKCILKSIPPLLTKEVRDDRRFIRNWQLFKDRTGYSPDLLRPRTFNEKLQWMKLYDRNPIYTQMADKYLVREYVRASAGGQLLNELLGVYETPEQIDLSELPQSFVLKTTHGSGWNIVCQDKADFNWEKVRQQLGLWLRMNYYPLGREWVYKNIRPRIIAERFLVDSQHDVPPDYKFYCFHGEPLFIQVDVDRFSNHTRSFYDTSWKRMPFELMYPACEADIQQPACLEQMLDYAKKLAGPLKFVRVDLYEVDQRVIFGEMTFQPESGTGGFRPAGYDLTLGSLIRL